MELKIIVGIEDVVLSIVLVVQRDLNRLESFREDRSCVHSINSSSVSVAAPLQKDLCEVLIALPVSGFDQGENTGTIRTRLCSEHPITRLRLRLLGRQILVLFEICQIMFARKVLVRSFVRLY